MALITEVRFAHEDGALAHTLAELPKLDARVVRESSTNPRQSVYYLGFDHYETARIEEVLADDHTVADATRMPGHDEQLIAVEFADEAQLMGPHVTNEGGLVVDARTSAPGHEPRGWHERWVFPDREAIESVWQQAREAGFTFTLLEFHRSGRVDGTDQGFDVLTEQQRETLAAAYEKGYFSEPRETSLEELGDSLDLSASAVGGRLKRGMKNVIGETLVVEGHRE